MAPVRQASALRLHDVQLFGSEIYNIMWPCVQVFAITNYLALFFPRGALLFELIQHMYEVSFKKYHESRFWVVVTHARAIPSHEPIQARFEREYAGITIFRALV